MINSEFNKLVKDGKISTDELLIALDKEEISEKDAIKFTIESGNVEQLKVLKEQGATIDPLQIMNAAYHGKNNVIQYLLNEFDIDFNLEDKIGLPLKLGGRAIICAASNNHIDTVDLLLKLGAVTDYTHKKAPHGDALENHHFFAAGKVADTILNAYKKVNKIEYHQYFSPQGTDTIEKYKNTYGDNKLSGFMLAARSGYFQDVLKSILDEQEKVIKPTSLSAAILLEKHPDTNMSILDHLHGYNQIKQVFVPELWEHNMSEFTKLAHAMPVEYRQDIKIKDLEHINNIYLVKKHSKDCHTAKLKRRPLPL